MCLKCAQKAIQEKQLVPEENFVDIPSQCDTITETASGTKIGYADLCIYKKFQRLNNPEAVTPSKLSLHELERYSEEQRRCKTSSTPKRQTIYKRKSSSKSSRSTGKKKKHVSKKTQGRLHNLSQPRTRIDNTEKQNPFCVSKSALSYKSTKRIASLAVPKTNKSQRNNMPRTNSRTRPISAPSKRLMELAKPKIQSCSTEKEYPYEVRSRALHYKASKRIQKLSIPKPNPGNTSTIRLRQSSINLPASKRVLELSQPKSRQDSLHIREDPNRISPYALKARLSKRMSELSKPKIYHSNS